MKLTLSERKNVKKHKNGSRIIGISNTSLILAPFKSLYLFMTITKGSRKKK